MTLKIIADEAIPYISESFCTLGKVVKLPASEIDRESVRDADGLIVRSITPISASLLEQSKVRFVGSATIGTDHVDISFLRKHHIQFASAPGCSASTVAEFVLHALYTLAEKNKTTLTDCIVGIIGIGNIGSVLKKRAEVLGISCLLNDPPLQEKHPELEYLPLDEVVERSDIISLHVPLTRTGRYPTFHLIDNSILRRSGSKVIWVNTSRGGVIDESALLSNQGKIGGLVLDVWENEPNINADVVEITDIATPHIAGYSIEGKLRATDMVYRAACQFFGMPELWHLEDVLEEIGWKNIQLDMEAATISDVILKAFDIRIDDAALRESIRQNDPGTHFGKLRNNYQYRREFSSSKINQSQLINQDALEVIPKLGFKLG